MSIGSLRSSGLVSLAVLAASVSTGCDRWPTPEPRAAPSGAALPKPGDAKLVTLGPAGQMELRYVAPGTFQMAKGGAYVSGIGRFLIEGLSIGSRPSMEEGPERTTTITRGMWVMRTKITAAQFAAFLNEVDDGTARGRLYADGRWPLYQIQSERRWRVRVGCEQSPIQNMTYAGALEFAAWASKHSGLELRLPTEAEWEFIARGEANRDVPVGTFEDARRLASSSQVHRDLDGCWTPATEPNNITPEGVADLVFSGGEWALDWFADSYDSNDRVDPNGPPSGQYRSVRGLKSVTSREGWPPSAGAGARLISVHTVD